MARSLRKAPPITQSFDLKVIVKLREMGIVITNKVDITYKDYIKGGSRIPAYHDNLFQHVYLSQIEHANIGAKSISCRNFYWYATTAPQLHMGG